MSLAPGQFSSSLNSIHFPPFLRCFQNPRILCYRCCFLGLRLEWTLIRFCLCSLFGMFNWFLETGFSLLQAFLFFLLFSENKIRPDTIFFFFSQHFFTTCYDCCSTLISHKYEIFHKCVADENKLKSHESTFILHLITTSLWKLLRPKTYWIKVNSRSMKLRCGFRILTFLGTRIGPCWD